VTNDVSMQPVYVAMKASFDREEEARNAHAELRKQALAVARQLEQARQDVLTLTEKLHAEETARRELESRLQALVAKYGGA